MLNTTRSFRRHLCCAAILLVAACSNERSAASRSTVTDSAGVQIVQSPAADTALPWQLVELARIGGADSGAQSFTRVSRYSVATDGRSLIAVLDGDADNLVHVFTADGVVQRSMGRRGGGPGETEFPNGLQMEADGTVGVFDGAKEALVRWGPDGTPLPELRISTARGRAWGAPRLQGGTMFTLLSFNDSANTTHRLERWSARDTVPIDSTIARQPRMVRFKCVGLALPPLFSPELEWAQRDGMLAVTTQSRYVIDVREGERLRRSVRRDIVPVAAKPTDASRLYPEGLKVRFGGGGECVTPSAEVGEKVGVAPTIPVVRAVAIAPDSSLWVERYTFKGETPSVDVFAADGSYVGTLTGRTLPLGFLDGDRVLFAITDPDDDTSVIGIFRIQR